MRIALALAGAFVCAAAFATDVTVLHSFDGTDGALPAGAVIQGADGNFYGTTEFGGTHACGSGTCGTVFKLTPANVLTKLHDFTGAEGSRPVGRLAQTSDGSLYGTTFTGGANNSGAIFKITTAGTYTLLHSFAKVISYRNEDGANPASGMVVGPDGNLYGTTEVAGMGGGTLFRITPAGTLTTLHKFVFEEGELPVGGVILGKDGNLYGGALFYGPSGGGSIFKFDLRTNAFSILHAFNGPDGDGPEGGLVQATDGALYGTTRAGGAANQGTVFRLTTGGALTTLHAFGNTPEGVFPISGLVQGNDNAIYGTTEFGGAGAGLIYRVTLGGHYSVVHTFVGGAQDGAFPNYGALTVGRDGAFYGVAPAGGTVDAGIVYKLPGSQRPPIWTAPTPADGAQFTATITRPFSLSLRATDPDLADQVHIAGVALPAGSTLTATDGRPAQAVLRWTPAAGQAGNYDVGFQAWDIDAPLSAAAARNYHVHVQKRSTAMTAQPALLDGEPSLHITIYLNATLTATDPSQPLGGKRVSFLTRTGLLICSRLTDSRGIASCSGVTPLAESVASAGYTARFDGDGAYNPSSAKGALVQ